MTICHSCGADNIQGVDNCVECGSDLAGLDAPRPHSSLEQHIMATRLKELTLDPPLFVEGSAKLGDVVDLLASKGKGCVLVRRGGQFAGIFGERDLLLKHAHRSDNWRDDPVESHMIPGPVTLKGSATIAHALNKMDIGDYRHIPVLGKDGEPMGVLSIKAIIRHITEWAGAV